MRLDALDAQIIKMLQGNARIMYKDIAKKIGVSIPTVTARIDKLLEFGVIKKFTVIVDSDKLAGKIRAVFLFKIEPRQMDAVCKSLSGLEEIREIYAIAGNYSVAAKIEVKDMKNLLDTVTKKVSTIKGVKDTTCLVIIDTLKEEYGGLVEPNLIISFRCQFCNAPIVGKPHVEYIGGGRYYFNSKDCAEAYKERKRKSQRKVIR